MVTVCPLSAAVGVTATLITLVPPLAAIVPPLKAHVISPLALLHDQFVPVADPIKISRLTLTNRSGRARRLSVTAYVEWVLGASRSAGDGGIP